MKIDYATHSMDSDTAPLLHALYILRRAQDYSSRTGTTFHCLFVDWKQAFDKLDHDTLPIALRRMGIHEQYIRSSPGYIHLPNVPHPWIERKKLTATPHTGIRQGRLLSPYLFIVVLSCVLRDVDDKLVRQRENQLTILNTPMILSCLGYQCPP